MFIVFPSANSLWSSMKGPTEKNKTQESEWRQLVELAELGMFLIDPTCRFKHFDIGSPLRVPWESLERSPLGGDKWLYMLLERVQAAGVLQLLWYRLWQMPTCKTSTQGTKLWVKSESEAWDLYGSLIAKLTANSRISMVLLGLLESLGLSASGTTSVTFPCAPVSCVAFLCKKTQCWFSLTCITSVPSVVQSKQMKQGACASMCVCVIFLKTPYAV